MVPATDGLVVVCTYRVRAGQQTAFEHLLEAHVPALRQLGLITNYPTHTLRRADGAEPVYVEVFEWASPDAAARAAEVPEVVAIWEPMAALCQARDGLPGLEFPRFDDLEVQR